MPKLYNMQYGIYTIQNESEIPKHLREDKYTFYVKINGRDIKGYESDYMDIMQDAFRFPTEYCEYWWEQFYEYMTDLEWLTYDEEKDTGYKNIILVFEHWNDVGRGLFSSGKKVREEILEDFTEKEDGIFSILAVEYEFIWSDDYTPCYTRDYEPIFKVFNIYLIP